jgi:hypothetical protein
MFQNLISEDGESNRIAITEAIINSYNGTTRTNSTSNHNSTGARKAHGIQYTSQEKITSK